MHSVPDLAERILGVQDVEPWKSWSKVFPRSPEGKPRNGCTYFILDAASNAVKIGHCKNVRSIALRMRDMQIGNPNELKCLGFTCSTTMEGWLHTFLEQDNLRGEWFRLTPRLQKIIDVVTIGS